MPDASTFIRMKRMNANVSTISHYLPTMVTVLPNFMISNKWYKRRIVEDVIGSVLDGGYPTTFASLLLDAGYPISAYTKIYDGGFP